ncbi:hypothetical protein HDU89_004690 [Geranomyces variabilis]|nr:hypothetical protein HDU89_004690 [Geranomyces variabilis]
MLPENNPIRNRNYQTAYLSPITVVTEYGRVMARQKRMQRPILPTLPLNDAFRTELGDLDPLFAAVIFPPYEPDKLTARADCLKEEGAWLLSMCEMLSASRRELDKAAEAEQTVEFKFPRLAPFDAGYSQ